MSKTNAPFNGTNLGEDAIVKYKNVCSEYKVSRCYQKLFLFAKDWAARQFVFFFARFGCAPEKKTLRAFVLGSMVIVLVIFSGVLGRVASD